MDNASFSSEMIINNIACRIELCINSACFNLSSRQSLPAFGEIHSRSIPARLVTDAGSSTFCKKKEKESNNSVMFISPWVKGKQ